MTNKQFYTMAEIKKMNKDAGFHFFSKDTMKAFGSKVHGGATNNYFVTSEDNFDASERGFTIRKFIPETCQIETVGRFLQYTYLYQAMKVIEKIAEGVGSE